MRRDERSVATRRISRTLILVASALAIAGCAANNAKIATAPTRTAVETKTASVAHARPKKWRVVRAHSSAPTPASFEGFASYYHEGSHVATGARYHPEGLTAAHRSLPFGTRLRVRDVKTGRSVIVTINDRGPFVHGRVLDLSVGAARALGMETRGVNRVRADVL
jgi:rare lipoprotein A